MSDLVCFKCRTQLDSSSAYCPQCGSSYSATEEDPETIRIERSFLLEQAWSLSDLTEPTFLGYQEEELLWKSQRRPALPLGSPTAHEGAATGRKELLELLTKGESRDRGQAALRLAEFQDPETIFGLLKHLGDTDPDVRICLLWALGKAENPLVVAPLLEFAAIEQNLDVCCQLAATLLRLITRVGKGKSKPERSSTGQEELAGIETTLMEEPDSTTYIARGKLHLRSGELLKAIGDFCRAADVHHEPLPEALLYRSQAFLLMGKPLYALDDLLVCPETHDYPAIYYLHRAALLTLAKQIEIGRAHV